MKTATAKLNIECLGGLRLTLGKKPLALPLKAQALVCYLAMSARPHSREALSGLLWGERHKLHLELEEVLSDGFW